MPDRSPYKIDENGNLKIERQTIGNRTVPVIAPPWQWSKDGSFGALFALWGRAWTVTHDLVVKLAELDRDTSLTAEGKADKLKQIVPDLVERLNERARALETVETALATLRGAIAKTAEPRDAIAADRFRDVVRWFLHLPQQKRMSVIGDAIEGGDRETLAAIMGAPRCYQLLDDEFRARVESAMAGDLVEQIEELSEARSCARQAFDGARAELNAATGLVRASA